MTFLPETKSRGAERQWPLWILVGIVLLAMALAVEAFLRAEDFAPGEEIFSPSIRDISVSQKNTLYPPANVGRFGRSPQTVFVYLSVQDAPPDRDMAVSISRTENASIPALIRSSEPEVFAVDEQEDQLTSGEKGATGVVKFALQTRSGDPIPAGNYTLEVREPSDGGAEGDVAARQYFVVEGR